MRWLVWFIFLFPLFAFNQKIFVVKKAQKLSGLFCSDKYYFKENMQFFEIDTSDREVYSTPFSNASSVISADSIRDFFFFDDSGAVYYCYYDKSPADLKTSSLRQLEKDNAVTATTYSMVGDTLQFSFPIKPTMTASLPGCTVVRFTGILNKGQKEIRIKQETLCGSANRSRSFIIKKLD